MSEFRTDIGKSVFYLKYAHNKNDSWDALAERLVDDVCGSKGGTEEPLLPKEEQEELKNAIKSFEFLPGGRYLYYAGRDIPAYFNCFLHIPQEDTREYWTKVVNWSTSSLMQGGGIGIDYSVFRPKGSPLKRTGGEASGPLSLMQMVNEIGRHVRQGGSRRSAIFGSLNWRHADANEFLHIKDWNDDIVRLKESDFNFPAPLDMTNISLGYDDHFLAYLSRGEIPQTFIDNCRQACKTSEPGMTFNYGGKAGETGRNACCEATTADEYDTCNLGSINISRIVDLERFARISYLSERFLYCGTVRGWIDHEETREIQKGNRRLGGGLMGMHEWLLSRGYRYEVVDELHQWLAVWARETERGANDLADSMGTPRPVAYRAIAPTGSIGMIAGTSTGIEPLFATAYKRRYLDGETWKYQYVVDGTTDAMIKKYDIDPDTIETAVDLAADPERRIKFQADVQDYVDMAISSTINLPQWGTEHNNEDTVDDFANTLAKYAHRLRGFTCYADGSRGGQPLTQVPYKEAIKQQGVEFEETDVCSLKEGGSCSI